MSVKEETRCAVAFVGVNTYAHKYIPPGLSGRFPLFVDLLACIGERNYFNSRNLINLNPAVCS